MLAGRLGLAKNAENAENVAKTMKNAEKKSFSFKNRTACSCLSTERALLSSRRRRRRRDLLLAGQLGLAKIAENAENVEKTMKNTEKMLKTLKRQRQMLKSKGSLFQKAEGPPAG